MSRNVWKWLGIAVAVAGIAALVSHLVRSKTRSVGG
jgi:hypothetical protein